DDQRRRFGGAFYEEEALLRIRLLAQLVVCLERIEVSQLIGEFQELSYPGQIPNGVDLEILARHRLQKCAGGTRPMHREFRQDKQCLANGKSSAACTAHQEI